MNKIDVQLRFIPVVALVGFYAGGWARINAPLAEMLATASVAAVILTVLYCVILCLVDFYRWNKSQERRHGQ